MCFRVLLECNISLHEIRFTDDAEHGGEGSSSSDPAKDPAGGKDQAEGT